VKRIAKWLRRVGGEDFTTLDAPLDVDVQNKVASDVALLNSLRLICVQRDLWNALVDTLEETTSIRITVDETTSALYLSLMAQLQASMVVIGETNNIPEDILDEIRRHQ